MSLSTVRYTDGFDQQRRGSSASTHRRMSFNPVADWVPERQRKESVATVLAFKEISKGWRICEYPPRPLPISS